MRIEFLLIEKALILNYFNANATSSIFKSDKRLSLAFTLLNAFFWDRALYKGNDQGSDTVSAITDCPYFPFDVVE